jgi:predicted metal-dependent HD superfamily phosphohydrolase
MKAWIDAVTRLDGDAVIARRAAEDLTRRYNEEHRRYHDLRHARSVAADADVLARELGIGEPDRAVITLAACAHDVVYDARPGEDERSSAEWAVRWLGEAGIASSEITTVERLVLATIGHEAPADDPLATALLDADLAILGASPAAYDGYAADVRQEYAAVDDDAWTAGRAKVVSTLLHREALYRSTPAKARWDAPARENLARELTRLRDVRDDQ